VLERAEHGFTNSGRPNHTGLMPSPLNEHGTFLSSSDVLPHFGYDDSPQIIDRNERWKRGLGDVPRFKKLEDASGYGSSRAAPDGDWIDFQTVLSTSEDQIALAPGYLERSWREHGRRYFAYKMDRPMLAFFCYLSARWQVQRGEWHGLPIEIYYDAKHPYNVARMIDATQKSLDYFTSQFSPYQFRQVRILEFPGYATFAQSFANTIPFSEAIGFVADLRKPDDIDYVYYVTSHEVAHQWWGHQVIGANVQGQTMLIESLAQYSALMVMEKQYGRAHMRKFLKYELDRYLRSRGGELIEELPLMRAENQPYIHYQKGSLVFYRLREEIGEEALNRALQRFLADKAFQQAPFTTSRELLDYVRAETPQDKLALLDELFARIVFYDNRMLELSSKRRPDGKYDVVLSFSCAKREADGLGKEHDVPLDDWLEVGLFARASSEPEASERVLYLERHRITTAQNKLQLVLDEAPSEAGIDPYNKLIDRAADDNRKRFD
jgi:ABC-2 type transport system permease protein